MRIELKGELRSLPALSLALGAQMSAVGSPPCELGGIATDSREVRAGDLFVCLQGAKTSGERFCTDALERGATAILSARAERFPFSYWHLSVSDTEQALLNAAAWHRRRCDPFVIAVTGSAGKTTAKEAIAAMLGDAPHSAGNYNSTVGMPLSVLSLKKAPYWVLELGINHKGEMQRMAGALSPDLGVLTNVGTAHIGQFGDFSTLFAQKAALAACLRPNGRFLMPSALPYAMIPTAPDRIWRFGQGGDVFAENIVIDQSGTRCDLRGKDRVITNLVWPIPGRIGVSVITLVGAVGMLLGCEDAQIRSGLKKAGESTPRMRQILHGERLLLDDSYNASPESVIAALEALQALAAGRPSVAVLGDMCELGKYSAALHDAVGCAFADKGHSMLFTCGREASMVAAGALRKGFAQDRVFCFSKEQKEELAREICARTPSNAAILFKGSRAMALDAVVSAVRRML